MLKKRYLCPKCRAELNPGTKIILKANLSSLKGLFLFSPRLGDYEVIHPADFPVHSGEEVEFSCPICSFDLTSPRSEQFAELLLAQGDELGQVVFSKVMGKQATFLIMPQRTETFGRDVGAYSTTNFFGEGPKE
jgi:hypothetical protein